LEPCGPRRIEMNLAATGTQMFTALATAQAATAGITESALAFTSDDQSSSESSFAMAENAPMYRILPVSGGLWVPVHEMKSDAAVSSDPARADESFDEATIIPGGGLGLMGMLLLGFLVMNIFTRSGSFVRNLIASGKSDKASGTSSKFTPFVRRGDAVSPYNPVRIGGEELPGKAVSGPEAISEMFGKKGIREEAGR